MIKQIFVNLPVKDLDRAKRFFSALGFTFNPQFTDENATCMILGEHMYAMLLVEKFFATFLTKPMSNAHNATEVLIAIALNSRAEVDTMLHHALASGAKEPRAAQDHGWMYLRVFEDLDGHVWEVTYMDESAIPAAP